MPRPTVIERARIYLASCEAPRRAKDDPQNSHNVVLWAARALTRGFNLVSAHALPLLAEYCQRSDEPWSEPELQHKIDAAIAGPAPQKGEGWLLRGDEREIGSAPDVAAKPEKEAAPPPQFDSEKLAFFAGDWAGRVDLLWLANRSYMDPATIDSGAFLRALYRAGEHVLVFTDTRSQGDAVWPREPLPRKSAEGVWFLAQPVDGEYHPNPRQRNMSRRSKESVLHWRYMVLESDEADARQWLGALVQLPLRIAAIYTSGKRSVHALIQIDARAESEWQEAKRALSPGLVILGADPGSLSCVRLTRLPGCYREKAKRWQKLLYLNPSPPAVPIVDLLCRRSIETLWMEAAIAATGAMQAKAAGAAASLKAALRGCAYYARVSTTLREAAEELRACIEMLKAHAK